MNALPVDLLTFDDEDLQTIGSAAEKLERPVSGFYCLKETECTVSLGSVENLDQSQKSEGSCGNSRC
jgi:hypothetical protein